MAKKYKRLVVISDLHCGHLSGLTHPGFDGGGHERRHPNIYAIRRAAWDWYTDTIDRLKPIDVLLTNGDCLDGKGKLSGGTELLTSDRDEQVEMAVAAIRYAQPKKLLMSYGTPYHVGRDEDWENRVAKDASADKIGGEDTVDINGWLINYRHHVGRSTIPHGRHTAIAKEKLWNELWAVRGEYPKSDILIRSHVHYHTYCGGPGWLALTTPALQAYGGKYGTRIMSGTVDFGLMSFDLYNKDNGGSYDMKPWILRFPKQEPLLV